MSRFKKATRTQSRLRLGLCGPSGSGKTFTAMRIAFAVAEARGKEFGRPGRVAVIDTESGSASKYVGESPDGFPWEFEVDTLTTFSPGEYIESLGAAAAEKFDVVVIDSLSHAWEGKDGALEMVDKKKDKGNSFTAWKDVTPLHRRMVDTILTSPFDIIATMRSKVEHVLEPDERGRMVPKKIGTAPIQRQGMEYEFDVFCDIDQSHILTVTKTRCNALDGAVVVKAGPGFARPLVEWLTTGNVVEIDQTSIRTNQQAERAPLVEKILTNADRIGWDRKRLDSEVTGKYRRAMDEITLEELTELASRLARLPDKRPVVVEVMDVPERKATDAQLATIKTLQVALFALIPEKDRQRGEWKSILSNYKVNSARDLTIPQAVLFITAVQNRIDMHANGGDPFGGPPSEPDPQAESPAVGATAVTDATPPT